MPIFAWAHSLHEPLAIARKSESREIEISRNEFMSPPARSRSSLSSLSYTPRRPHLTLAAVRPLRERRPLSRPGAILRPPRLPTRADRQTQLVPHRAPRGARIRRGRSSRCGGYLPFRIRDFHAHFSCGRKLELRPRPGPGQGGDSSPCS